MLSSIVALAKSFDFVGKAISWAVRIFVLVTMITAIPFTFRISVEFFTILVDSRVVNTLRTLSFFVPVGYIIGCIGTLLVTKHWKLVYNMFLRIFELIFKD